MIDNFLGFPIVRTEQEEDEVKGTYAKYNDKEERWELLNKFNPKNFELWKKLPD